MVRRYTINEDNNDDKGDDDDDGIVIEVMIGATESNPKSFRKYRSNTPGKHNIMVLQNTAVLGTAHVRGAFKL